MSFTLTEYTSIVQTHVHALIFWIVGLGCERKWYFKLFWLVSEIIRGCAYFRVNYSATLETDIWSSSAINCAYAYSFG